MSLIKLMTQAEAAASIKALATDAKSVQDRIHIIGCSTLDHTRAFGDYRGAEALLNALPNGQRVKALAHWFGHFSNKKLTFKFDKKSGLWAATLQKDRTDEDFKVDEAMDTTFADLTTERDPVTLSLEKFIKGLERTANNDEKFDGTEVDKVSPEVRTAAAALVKFYRDNVKVSIAA